jgi:hypothetical protein
MTTPLDEAVTQTLKEAPSLPVRTKEEIDKEYSAIATQLGDRMHRMQVMQELELPALHKRMLELSKEYQAIQAAPKPTPVTPSEAL